MSSDKKQEQEQQYHRVRHVQIGGKAVELLVAGALSGQVTTQDGQSLGVPILQQLKALHGVQPAEGVRGIALVLELALPVDKDGKALPFKPAPRILQPNGQQTRQVNQSKKK